MDAGDARIEVRFTLGRRDGYDLFRTLAGDAQLRLMRRRAALPAVGLSLAIAVLAVASGLTILLPAAVALLVVGVAGVNGTVWAWFLTRRRVARLNWGDRSLAVDPTGIVCVDAAGASTTTPWGAVLRVCEGDRWIGFFVRQVSQAFAVVPLPATGLGDDERARIRAWAGAGDRPWIDLRRVATPATTG